MFIRDLGEIRGFVKPDFARDFYGHTNFFSAAICGSIGSGRRPSTDNLASPVLIRTPTPPRHRVQLQPWIHQPHPIQKLHRDGGMTPVSTPEFTFPNPVVLEATRRSESSPVLWETLVLITHQIIL
jgi:hypothetical protein